jgi:Fe-coproporphyrin III synthase
MIGCTKLLCGMATVSDALKLMGSTEEIPSQILQFSAVNRPLVVWNVTQRCNLRCQHCYIDAEDHDYSHEITTQQAEVFIDDLAEMKVPVLLLSGGEPLMREDIFHLSRYGTDKGLRVILSTNGTLITRDIARRMNDAGMKYAGVSLDGLQEKHDQFRGMEGAFDLALAGIRHCMELGIKTGIRFTLNSNNRDDLSGVLDLLKKEAVPRFCMYHLVYSGRGKSMIDADTSLSEKRKTMEFLVEKTLEFHRLGIQTELLTVDNHADGIYIYHYLMKKDPQRASEIMQLLKMHGGCSAGTKFSNVDPLGNVHPCQFWQDRSLGNILERKFSSIWNDPEDPFLIGMRQKSNMLKGRCGVCHYKELCGGCRIRAEAVHGDLWAEDPACYLTDAEIGICS